MIYAVIDTNVLVSALITKNPRAATAQVVRLLLERRFAPMYDAAIIAEYREVLLRPKFAIHPDTVEALLAYILKYGVKTVGVDYLEPMPDEDDRVFYEVALSKTNAFLVTGNLKHYPVSHHIITPAEFLAQLQQTD